MRESRVAAFVALGFIDRDALRRPGRGGRQDRLHRPAVRRRRQRRHSGAEAHQFYIDAINAAGGLNGEKLELLSFDNKVNPQESLIALKKALDEGARYVFQGNGSAVALAITDAVLKYNERNPGKEVLFFNYAAVDPALTNEKCNFWHFRFDADADMKMAALTDVDREAAEGQEGLPDQPGLLVRQGGRGGGAARCSPRSAPTSRSSATSCIRCRRCRTSRPTSPRSRPSGADTVITGNWSNDMVLLIKAGKDAGLKVTWYTYYGGALGAPDRDRQGRHRRGQAGHASGTTTRCPSSIPTSAAFKQALHRQGGRVRLLPAQDRRSTMFAAAAAKAKSNDPVKVAKALEGHEDDDHASATSRCAPTTTSCCSRCSSRRFADNVKFDVEKTGLGFKTDAKIDGKDTALPTTCKMQRPKLTPCAGRSASSPRSGIGCGARGPRSFHVGSSSPCSSSSPSRC